MIIYRVQHKVTREGCYRGSKAMDFSHYDWENHPTPSNDSNAMSKAWFKRKRGGVTLFGFKTLNQLEKWFDKKERKLLKQSEFVIVVYDAEKEYAYASRKQAIFNIKHSNKIGEIELEF